MVYNRVMLDREKLNIQTLRWTTWNVEHIGRSGHEVTPEEVEEIVFGHRSIVGVAHTGRTMIIGPTKKGRMLVAVISPDGNGVWYCVSARTASAKERRTYREE